jgi:hypothetical protein
MNLNDLFTTILTDPNAIKKLGSEVGVDPSKVQELAKLGLPAILSSITQNANTTQGAESLFKALEQHQEDPVDDLENYIDQADSKDGEKILQHVFTNNNENVQQKLANKTGLDMSQVTGILSKLAPLILGVLGQQKKEQNLNASSVSEFTQGITSALNQSGTGGLMGIVTQLLDSDKDGNIVDDIGNMLGGFFKGK